MTPAPDSKFSHAAAPAAAPGTADRVRGRLMAQSLGLLLDQARGAREVLPHLAAMERSLLEAGAQAIEQVPPHWLGRICSQLSSLPLPDQDPPLHDLLQRLMDRLADQHDDWRPSGVFDPERTVVIREISHSEYAAAEDEQAETVFTPRL